MAPALELLPKSTETVPVKAIPATSNGASAAALVKFESPEKHQRVLNVFRAFIADLVQQYGDGHPGYIDPCFEWLHLFGVQC